MSKIEIIRATTVPMSLNAFCNGMLKELSEKYDVVALSSPGEEQTVITTRATGCVDSIIDGDTGIFVKHDDEELYDALSQLYDDDIKRKDMGKKGREFVVGHFLPQMVWKDIEKLYQR